MRDRRTAEHVQGKDMDAPDPTMRAGDSTLKIKI
jgi:hypothetical protein